MGRQVYERICRAIMSGAFAPGASLSTRSLADRFSVSPMPVREALKRLEADGVVVGRAKSAFVLLDPTTAEFGELLDIRLRLEGLAAAEAARRMDLPTLTRVQALHKQLETYDGDLAGLLTLNFAFHFAVYESAGRPVLLAMIERLWLRIGPVLHASAGYDAAAVAANHALLLDALERGDAPAAEAALGRDLIEAAAEIGPRLRS